MKHILKKTTHRIILFLFVGLAHVGYSQKKYSDKQVEKLKADAAQMVQANCKQAQVMVDKVFSFSELGFQEIESS
mgnify:FL=1